ncbi:MAG: threonylcarbamoyl-AMP synthase [Clostridia bacterium]|nr:threonylcarbamoyl-AMP synthase [Clostridia bacterium]
MKTEVLEVTEKSDSILERAAELIRSGALVGIPTETVYGLGANAYNRDACLNIFKAKGRPADNPLIVHIARPEDAENIAYTNALYYKLAVRFMPGPLTVILPKKDIIPDSVTAGLDTVAIRCPANPVANRLIEIAGVPIAAPSANKSGMPSPTSAVHVYNDMNGEIPMILDGGECEVGVESTVISITDDSIMLLRPGQVTVEMLSEVCENVSVSSAVIEELKPGEKALSPGMKYKHYAPVANLYLVNGEYIDFVSFTKEKSTKEKCAVMCYDEEIALYEKEILLPVGKKDDIKEQTKRLFNLLRKADELGVQTIYAHLPKKEGAALAIYNRMIRACAHRILGGENG